MYDYKIDLDSLLNLSYGLFKIYLFGVSENSLISKIVNIRQKQDSEISKYPELVKIKKQFELKDTKQKKQELANSNLSKFIRGHL